MKIKTKDLTGAALDWAVAVALGYQPLVMPIGRAKYAVGVTVAGDDGKVTGFACRYSTDWAQGGPLIERFNIWLDGPICGVSIWSASVMDTQLNEFSASHDCETPLIAICRAVVACKLGDEVEVPDELAGAA